MLEGNGSVKKAESNIEDAMDIVTDSETHGFDEMKKKLKESEEGKKVLMTEYLKCERELRIKTEENGKLKTEVTDLKEIMELKEQLKEFPLTPMGVLAHRLRTLDRSLVPPSA